MKTKKSSEFKIGEMVVYPKHGVGEITKIENISESVNSIDRGAIFPPS